MTQQATDTSAQTLATAGLGEVEQATGTVLPTDAPPTSVTIDPRTEEPQRVWTIPVSAVASLLAVAASAASLLWTYWTAVGDFGGASWLLSRFSEPEVRTEILLVVAVTVASLVVGTLNSITAYYAWAGYGWTRIGGIVSASASLLMLLLNPIGWAAIPLALIGAGLLWLPASTAFFNTWRQLRHPATELAPSTAPVYYGPLARYRRHS